MATRESSAPVTALVAASAAGLRGAVDAPELAPDVVREVDSGSLLSAAAGLRAPGWAWVLDGSALPRPDALARLLAAARDAASAGLPAPAVLDWTARLLREATGYAVPASVAGAAGAGGWRIDALGRDPREDARRTAAALADPGWA